MKNLLIMLVIHFEVLFMGAQTRGDEVVKPPKGFSNHLWPPKELIFRIFHIFFSKICKIFPPTFSSISLKISIFLQFLDWPPQVLRYHPEDHLKKKRKKKGLQLYKKNLDAWKFFYDIWPPHTPWAEKILAPMVVYLLLTT